MWKKLKYFLIGFTLILALLILVWFSVVYQMSYKRSVRDISASPDGRYELRLLEIGEPAWPFGPASGRLELLAGNTEICRSDFELRNDGGHISPGCWTVDWNENGAAVVLSGEEQEDEYICLYFDGSISYETEPVDNLRKLEFNVKENRENELVFDVSMDEFIDSYNSFYSADHVNPYLRPRSDWRVLTVDHAVHSDHETSLYEFSLDERIWSQPTVTVYVPTDGDYIQAVTVNFDEHGYSDTFYAHFEALCYYTLKVFFPEMADDEIHELYQEANELGNLNVFLNEDGYERGCVPCVLYHKDEIGVYPYFAIGEWTHLCIIPVSQEILNHYASLGTELRVIP